jgi:hypothetical protein
LPASEPLREPDVDPAAEVAVMLSPAPAMAIAALHGRATTRAEQHPVASRTISRTTVADRLRIRFDKRRPPPLALVAAVAQ